MAGTNLMFSVGVLDGLSRLGHRFERVEREALVHLWRYAGYLLGIQPELLIAEEFEGTRLLDLMFAFEPEPDDDSRAHAKLLSDCVDQYTAAGQPLFVDTVAAAYHFLKAAGRLQEPEPEVAELSNDELAHQKHVTELAKNVDKMSDSQLDSLLQGLGVWVPKTGGRMWREE